jgi:hypothetical protein
MGDPDMERVENHYSDMCQKETTVKTYFSFGQSHVHSVDGFTFDKDVIVEIEAPTRGDARKIMFDTFGRKWSMQYNEKPDMGYFPRGIKAI